MRGEKVLFLGGIPEILSGGGRRAVAPLFKTCAKMWSRAGEGGRKESLLTLKENLCRAVEE